MSVQTPRLDLTIFDSHDPKKLVIGDSSYYPAGWTISNPTLQITVPGYGTKTVTFVAQSINIYTSNDLGITCDADPCDLADLPDGIYTIKYTINPAYKYSIIKSFMKVDAIWAKFDDKFLNLEMFTCDSQLSRNRQLQIDEIEFYINGAISAGNKCASKLAIDLYNKADRLLKLLNPKCN